MDWSKIKWTLAWVDDGNQIKEFDNMAKAQLWVMENLKDIPFKLTGK